jgi:hypothetical protein
VQGRHGVLPAVCAVLHYATVQRADSTSTLPTGLARIRVIAWTWEDATSAVKQMMGEGKNVQ